MKNTATLTSVFVGVSLVAIANAAGIHRGSKTADEEVLLMRADQSGPVSVRIADKAGQTVVRQEIVAGLQEFGFAIVRSRISGDSGRSCQVFIINPESGREIVIGCSTPDTTVPFARRDSAADVVSSVKDFVRGEKSAIDRASKRSWPMIVG